MNSNLGVATTHIVAPVLRGSAASTGVTDSGSIFHSSKIFLHLSKEVISPLLERGPSGYLLVCTGPLLSREDSVLPVTRHIQVKLGMVSHDVYAPSSELL